MNSGFSFSLPRLIGNVLIFLTPTGLLAVVALLLHRRRIDWPGFASPAASLPSAQQVRSRALLLWLAIFPLAVFIAASLTRVSKLNWTGPLWLALLPLLACLMPAGETAKATTPASPLPKLMTWCRRAWPPTLVICLLLYGGALHWLSLGLPGVGYPNNLHLLGWRDFGRDIEQRVQYLERQRGEPVLVVGMDRNRIASGLAFYRTLYLETAGQPHAADAKPAFTTASQNLFGDVGLMYRLWFPSDQQTGKTLLLVAEKVAELNAPRVLERVRTAGEIQEVRIWKQGKPAGRYYLRLVTGYHDLAGDARAVVGDAADD